MDAIFYLCEEKKNVDRPTTIHVKSWLCPSERERHSLQVGGEDTVKWGESKYKY